MTREDKINVFKELLDKFETEEMRLYCEDMIEWIPDYIFTIPSSTSLKYHNKTQCQEHGQVLHMIMFGEVMNYILGLKYVKEKMINPRQRDCLRCTPIFHDAIKCGENGSKYTVFDHPLLASKWIKQVVVEHDIDEETKEYIASLCESHSGEWTTSKRSSLVLPEPKTDDAFLVHLCDYLSSRSNIDMEYSVLTKEAVLNCEVEKPTVDTYVFDFGKYKGLKLMDVVRTNPSYIDWLKNNVNREPLSTLLNQLGEV